MAGKSNVVVKEVKIQCAKLEKLWLNIWQPYGAGNYSFDCPNAQLLKFCVYNWKNPLTVTINVKSLESAIIAFSEEPKTVHLNVREPIKILNTVLKDVTFVLKYYSNFQRKCISILKLQKN